MTFFLTNGLEFVGPYHYGEVRAPQRGIAQLQYGGYRDVYRVTAATLEEAKRRWRLRGQTPKGMYS